MTTINRGLNEANNTKKVPGQLVIKAHYAADDGSTNLVYSIKSAKPVSRARQYLHELAQGVYHDIEDPVIVLPGSEELYIVKMSVYEVIYDVHGEIIEEYLLEEFGI